jgi:hypothetical protein
MLGRSDYMPEELGHAEAVVAQQLAAYRRLAAAFFADLERTSVSR